MLALFFTESPEVQKIIYYITLPDLQEKLFLAKVIFIFFTLAFLTGVIYFVVKSSYLEIQIVRDLTEFFTWKPYGFIRLKKSWEKIQKRVVTGSESEYKVAIIEADNLLNATLEKRGYKGKNFEERIGQVEKDTLSNPEEVLGAHKIRNFIVYDPDYKLDLDEAKKTLKIYEEAIQNIGTF